MLPQETHHHSSHCLHNHYPQAPFYFKNNLKSPAYFFYASHDTSPNTESTVSGHRYLGTETVAAAMTEETGELRLLSYSASQ